MSFRKPVNTGLCLGPDGTFCAATTAPTTVYLSSGTTTNLLGTGAQLNPYIIEVKIDGSDDNGLIVTGDGLFIDKTTLLDVSFSDDLFS